VLEDARDSVQTLYVGGASIMTGSVDGHVRTYDLRKGELRADYIGRMFTPVFIFYPSDLMSFGIVAQIQ
jgi:mitogen-activated protein kinase organizer 1